MKTFLVITLILAIGVITLIVINNSTKNDKQTTITNALGSLPSVHNATVVTTATATNTHH